MLLETNIL